MSNQTPVPTPYSQSIIAGLVQPLSAFSASQEGGVNVFQEDVPHGGNPISVYKQLNPFRKTLSLYNNGTVPLVMVILNSQNVENFIPLPVGGGWNFVWIKIGTIEQCVNGINLSQDVVRCEYQGIIKIQNNDPSVDGSVLIVEVV
jgi:hypothetical protein